MALGEAVSELTAAQETGQALVVVWPSSPTPGHTDWNEGQMGQRGSSPQ